MSLDLWKLSRPFGFDFINTNRNSRGRTKCNYNFALAYNLSRWQITNEWRSKVKKILRRVPHLAYNQE